MGRFARFWDWLPRIAALVACGLMAWSVLPQTAARTPANARAGGSGDDGGPAVAVERVEVQTTADSPHVGLLCVLTVAATAPGTVTAAVTARIHDRDGRLVWTDEIGLSLTASGGSAATWRSLPRTLPVERYHSATAALREAVFRPARP
ncbi:MAG: hypothetical protein RLZZ127_424 [Planctomycetota bacterium]|jgi:hypothetical protein